MSDQSEKNSTSSIKLYQDEDWLESQYQSKSIYQIASECSVAPSTIRKFLKRFGIKSRSISDSMKLKYKDDEYLQKKQEQWKSDEYRQKHAGIAERNKGLKSIISKELWVNQDFKDKNFKAHAEAMADEQVRDNISNGIKQKWQEDEYRAKQEALSEIKSQNFSEIMLKLWQDESYKSNKLIENRIQGEERRLDTVEFVERAQAKHGDHFGYNDVNYITYDRHKVDIICVECGYLFSQLPGNHLKSAKCPRCHTSQGQREIYDFVNQHVECYLNDRSIIHPYELDIWIPSAKLAIEYHGLRWHSFDRLESADEQKVLQRKWLLTKESDISLLQFFDFQWAEKPTIVKSMILHKLGLSQKIDARKLSISSITKNDAKIFFDTNHLYGSRPAKYNFGLIDNNCIQMVMSVSGEMNMEIVRVATKIGRVVRGGLSRLLAYIVRLLSPTTINSFADLCFSDGVGYFNAGFKTIGITKPGYFYYKGNKRLSRQKCQKHRLHKLLGNEFDPNESETINMFRNGFRRVWDAGNLKLVYKI